MLSMPFRPALGRLLPEWRTPGETTHEPPVVLAEGVVRLLTAVAGESAVLLVLEDLHWADQETLAVLEYLVDALRTQPVLCVATVRSEGQFNTIIYEEHDTYRYKATRDTVFLNRDDMAAFGVSDGQRITLASDTGKMPATAMAYDLPRGSALAYYPEANVLTGTAVDPRSRTPAFKSVPVWIEA